MTPLDAAILGQRVRRARLARGLTLKQVESLAKVSATHISEVERGKTSPTVGALERIARAMRVDLAGLIEPHIERTLACTRAGERPVWTFEPGGLRLEPLTVSRSESVLSFFLATLPPGGRAQPRVAEAGGEDLVDVIEGSLEIRSELGIHVLSNGGSFHVKRARHPLVFANIGKGPLSFLWAITPKLSV